MIQMLKGKIGHIHLIDSDGTLHNDETSTHRPFGEGLLDFDAIMPALNQSGCNSPWWAIDLCFWPGSWEATPGLQTVHGPAEREVRRGSPGTGQVKRNGI